MDKEEFYQWTTNMLGAFPNDPAKRREVSELYFLALSEIEEGGSERHEIDSAVRSIKELIEEYQAADKN
jgi:hypothetical protein